MNQQDVYRRIEEIRIVPVVAIEDAGAALGLADALIEGGLPLAEITFRTAVAADVISTLTRERPELLVGAGTVLTTETVARARDAGAAFAVSPGFNPAVVRAAVSAGLPFAPGVMTPSDIEGALALGVEVLKFFPAGAAGGPPMLQSLSAPYAHLGVRFIPTGGVKEENLADYLSLSAVLAVGGTWLATKDDIREGRWEVIVENCRRARALVVGKGDEAR
jgi:2-dehydro-3-deoxyphosphogluconate aldolase/(4S)-4-hydroxy-2-oxoglutarate aldolase